MGLHIDRMHGNSLCICLAIIDTDKKQNEFENLPIWQVISMQTTKNYAQSPLCVKELLIYWQKFRDALDFQIQIKV